MRKIFQFIFCAACALFMLAGCKKDWLEAKPDKALLVPSTVDDYQALLDNIGVINVAPSIGEAGSDNTFIAPGTIVSQSALVVNTYIWATNGWQGNPSIFDWNNAYKAIFAANTVITGTNKIDNASAPQILSSVRASALFLRAYHYFELAQIFCKPYESTSASTDAGIPLRLEADITTTVGRGTVQQIYDQILADLYAAKDQLAVSSTYKSRPVKTAAYAMLARVYLTMGDYDKALLYADSTLKMKNSLLDYNSSLVNTTSSASTPAMTSYANNPEIIFYARMPNSGNLAQARANMDSTLYQSYVTNDLRKTAYFGITGGRTVYRGSYDGSVTYNFEGLAVDEMYLIRAECSARKGDYASSIADLNTLLVKRWKTGTYLAMTATSGDDALAKVLTERRKELIMRNRRWTDLRRLNMDTRFAKTITRTYNNQTYTLAPGSNLYTWPIPDNEILYSGIQQNPR